MPPDRMPGFNPGPWNHHPGLSFLVCTKKAVCDLLNHIPFGKHVVVQGGEMDTSPTDMGWVYSNLHGIRLACYHTAILPIFMPTHGLAYSHPTRYGSSNLLVSTMHNIQFIGMLHNMP